MPNDSSTGGYLAATTGMLSEAEIYKLLHDVIAGVTGYGSDKGDLIRPAWQPVPPAELPADQDWIAYRIINTDREGHPAFVHSSNAGVGEDELQRSVNVDALISFYGPGSFDMANYFADAVFVPQNREAMSAQGVSFTTAGNIVAAPAYTNEQWIKKHDLSARLTMRIARRFPVRDLISASGRILEHPGEPGVGPLIETDFDTTQTGG